MNKTPLMLFVVSACAVFSSHSDQTSTVCPEFSLILGASTIAGVGVFAAHHIAAGTRILRHTPAGVSFLGAPARIVNIKDIPPEFLKYCVHINDEECIAPLQFDHMEIAWYINHSATPNSHIQKIDGTLQLHAIHDISIGEEITYDYNTLNEPEKFKEDYYT